MVQWLTLCAPNAGGPGSIPGQGTRCHTLQLKIPGAPTKTQLGQMFCFFFKEVFRKESTIIAAPMKEEYFHATKNEANII